MPPLRDSLDQPQASGAAQLALVRHTKRATLRSSNSARLNLRLLAPDLRRCTGEWVVLTVPSLIEQLAVIAWLVTSVIKEVTDVASDYPAKLTRIYGDSAIYFYVELNR